jgi:hypothetical protein
MLWVPEIMAALIPKILAYPTKEVGIGGVSTKSGYRQTK